MSEKITDWDSAELLTTPEHITAYLEAALEENDPAFFVHALGIVARARGMTQLAKDAGVSREGLYKTLSEDGNPSFMTVAKVMQSLGLRLAAAPTM
jgi:probable addiction module antidote protein